MSARGRGPDSTLVHMSPREVEGLQKLAVANGTTLTINPDTGLPEAFSLQDLLPTLIGGAATYLTGGAITPLMAALGTGAVTALTSKDLGKGLMAGLGAYSGAGLVSGLAGFGAADIGEKAIGSATADATAAGFVNGPIGLDPSGLERSGADAYAAAVQKGVGDRMAGASYSDRFGAGLSKAMSDPMGAANAVGGGSAGKGFATLAGALSPLLAGETGNTVQTVTQRRLPRPKQPSVYDNMSQTFERYAANGGLMGLANGGAVRYADGGFAATSFYDPNANFMASNGPDARTLAYINDRFGTSSPAATTVATNNTADAGEGFAATPTPVATAAAPVAATAPLAAAQVFPQEVSGIAALSQASIPVAQGAPVRTNNAMANNMGAAATPLLTDQVYDLFMNVLDRPPSEQDMNYWATQFGINNTKLDANEIEDFKKAASGEISKRQASDSGKDYIPISQLDNLYMQELSRHGEYGTGGKEGGMEFWKRTFGNYIDPKELAGFRTEAAKERAAREAAKLPTVVTDLTTAAPIYLKEGVGGSSGAGQVGGGTVVNPNGTITTSPRIPNIRVGGFSGMTDVKRTYTDSGGDLGYTSPTYTLDEFNKKYKNTGSQKEMYDYLMGKGDRPTKTKNADGTFREVSRPYNEAVLGVPGSTNVKRIWNATEGKYFRNPDYMRQRTIRDPVTKEKSTINYMSTNQAKAALAKTPLEGNALAYWSIENFVDPETLAEATGMNQNQITTLLAKAKADKSYVKKVAGGGLVSLANGGLAGVGYADGGLPDKEFTNSVTGVKYYFDFANGIYRPETSVKDGVTYKWNPVTNKYETGASNASGIASLMDTSDGSPGGGENAPNTIPDYSVLANIGRSLSDMGLETFGGYLSQQAREGRTGQQGIPTDIQDSSRDDTRGPMRGKSGVADIDIGLPTSFGKSGSADQDVGPPVSAPDSRPGGGDIAEGDPTGAEGDPTGADAAPADSAANGGMIGRYAQGGLGSLGGYSDGGRLLRGPGDGVSDSIPASIGNRQPARLADGEFVVPARIVSELGNGSTEAGARALYKMMARIQANRRKTTGKNSVAVDSKAHKYLPA